MSRRAPGSFSLVELVVVVVVLAVLALVAVPTFASIRGSSLDGKVADRDAALLRSAHNVRVALAVDWDEALDVAAAEFPTFAEQGLTASSSVTMVPASVSESTGLDVVSWVQADGVVATATRTAPDRVVRCRTFVEHPTVECQRFGAAPGTAYAVVTFDESDPPVPDQPEEEPPPTTTTTEPPPTTTTTEPPPTTTTTEPPPTTTTEAPTTTTTTEPPPEVPAPTPWVPTGAGAGFSLLIEQDTDMRFNSTGAVAAGGDFDFERQQTIVSGDEDDLVYIVEGEVAATSLIIGGHLDLTPVGPSGQRGQLVVPQGNVYVGQLTGAVKTFNGFSWLVPSANSNQNARPVIQTTSTQTEASIVQTGVFPFTLSFDQLRTRSDDLAALTPTTCAAVHETILETSPNRLTLEPDMVNVLNVNVADLPTHANNMDIPVTWSADTPLVINILDDGEVTFPRFQWGQQGHASGLLWNFPNATHVNATGQNNFGTILAPYATFDANGFGSIEGAVFAQTWTQSTQLVDITNRQFTAEIAC